MDSHAFKKLRCGRVKSNLEGPSLSLLPAQKLEAILKNCRVWWENDLSKAPRIARQFLPCRGSWLENALVRFARKCRCWEQPSSANWIVCSRTTPSAKMEPVNQIMLWSSRTILYATTRIYTHLLCSRQRQFHGIKFIFSWENNKEAGELGSCIVNMARLPIDRVSHAAEAKKTNSKNTWWLCYNWGK